MNSNVCFEKQTLEIKKQTQIVIINALKHAKNLIKIKIRAMQKALKVIFSNAFSYMQQKQEN